MSLSNIGDIVLTFPVMDKLLHDFPQSELSLVIGPKGESLFKNHPRLKSVYIYDKRQKLPQTLKMIGQLRTEGFDLVVDLRHTLIPFLVGARYHTPMIFRAEKNLHMKEKHLKHLSAVYAYTPNSSGQMIHLSKKDEDDLESIIKEKIGGGTIVAIAPGAAAENKRWATENFVRLAENLIRLYSMKTVFIGDGEDKKLIDHALKGKDPKVYINLSSDLNLLQLAGLLRKVSLFIGNDSAPMHLASYLNIPSIALFGPTDPLLYGPWSERSYFVQHQLQCLRCQKPSSKATHLCMQAISVDDILNMITIHDGKVTFKEILT